MLLGPVEKELGTKRLVVAAQGLLQFIPFGLLPAPAPNAATRPLLIAEHEIVSVPSASTLALLRREVSGRRSAPKSIAVLADPVFSRDDERVGSTDGRLEAAPSAISPAGFKERPGSQAASGRSANEEAAPGYFQRLFISRWEAQRITSLVPAGDSLQVLDFAVTREVAESPDLAQYRIIHFATHSIIDNVHPELSGIVLSLVDEHGRARDGFLRAYDIFNLKFPAELIVLSACRTGLGKDVEGEGLVGITRSFMYAGAPRVVVSLWAVNDKATSELMVRFYRRMLGPEHLSPAAALRMAQLEMSKDKRWQSPYFWGAFTLQGEWRTSNSPSPPH
jgi:CHAT domain-containing protein